MNDPVELLVGLLKVYSPSGQEAPAVDFLLEAMRNLGFQAHRDRAGNAVGVVGDGPTTLVMLGHVDTVEGFIPVRLEDGKLYGRGAVDAKGPLAAFIWAAARAVECGAAEGKRIVVVGAVEEEAATSKGARQVMLDYSPQYAIIGEPSSWDSITLGYKGRLLVRWTRRSPMRHTARPEPSIAEQAVDFWLAMKEFCSSYNADVRGAFQQVDPSLRHISSGGDGFAEWAEAVVAFRLPVGLDRGRLKSYVRSVSGQAEIEMWGEEKAFKADKNNPLVRAMIRAIREAGGRPTFKVKTGTSDMNVVASKWNCPMAAYGPGDSSLDHTPDEHVLIDEYKKAIEVLTRTLQLL